MVLDNALSAQCEDETASRRLKRAALRRRCKWMVQLVNRVRAENIALDILWLEKALDASGIREGCK